MEAYCLAWCGKGVLILHLRTPILGLALGRARNCEVREGERMIDELVALHWERGTADAFPSLSEWNKTDAAGFCLDWQGRKDDRARQTEVRVMWTPSTLYLRFVCHYRELVVFEDAETSGRRDGLWDRDVAEAFLQPDRFGSRHYSEIEIAPNGMWVDLEIFPGGRRPLESGMRSSAQVEDKRVWTGQVAIPMASIAPNFNPDQAWRVNFFRCEGRDPRRWYSAWQPTHTPVPAFHVPEKFGVLRFK